MAEHPLAALQKLDPELMDHLQASDALIFADRALPRKFKLLVAMAFDAAAGAESGVRALANAALQAGATREELYPVVNLLVSTLGFPTAAAAFSWVNDILKADT